MLKTIDLFAGAGGLSLGFLQTGKFQLVAAAEINPNARNTYAKNISDNNPEFEFIENVVVKKHLCGKKSTACTYFNSDYK